MKIKRLNEHATIPTKNHNAAAFDLYASEDIMIAAGEKKIVKTAIAIELPKGIFAQITGRSGISAKTPINVITGTIDNDYRGELGVIIQNTNAISKDRVNELTLLSGKKIKLNEDIKVPKGLYNIQKGDRIAQLVLFHQVDTEIEEVDELNNTERNERGFGSSGV